MTPPPRPVLPPAQKPGEQCKAPRQQHCGTGWGGAWTAKDDFIARRRSTKWCQGDSPSPKKGSVPPRLYVDNKTLIREVADVETLRRGDHCLIAINLLRCVSPGLDHLISCLGSFELCYFYHHFIIMDDVAKVDEGGIPRTRTGELAKLMEYGNTVPEAIREVCTTTSGRLWRLPAVATRFLLHHKSKCHLLPLADYGDTPHIYRVVEDLTPQQREGIVAKAWHTVQNPSRYNVLFNNCEHVSNAVSKGTFTSPNVHFLLWNLMRTSLCCVGLAFLNAAARSCYSQLLCRSYPVGAMVAYYLFSVLPVLMQAALSYVLVARSVWQKYKKALISHDDCWHLLGKELGRLVFVGGGATAGTLLAPRLLHRGCSFSEACWLCFFAYAVSDLLYNCLAHFFMRCVLLPLWGRVWLIGGGHKAE